MIARNMAWIPALAATAAILVGGAYWTRTSNATVVGLEREAAAFEHAVEELEQLATLSDALDRLTHEDAGELLEEDRDALLTLARRLSDWRAYLTDPDLRGVEDGADLSVVIFDMDRYRGAGAVALYDLGKRIAAAKTHMLRHPGRLRDLARRLRQESEATLPPARLAASQVATRARLGREGLRLHGALWTGAALLSLVLTGIFILRPMATRLHRKSTALAELERRMLHGALHDPLTGLPNRRYLAEHAAHALAAAGRGGRVAAALHVNLDRFKAVNDTMGMAAGDKVLRRAAGLLRTETRRGDFIARVGADEFVVIVPEVVTLEDLVSLASRLLERLSEPMVIDGDEVRTGACIGIALAEPDRIGPDRLLGNADLALLDAKSGGRNRYAFFTDHRRAEFENRRRIAAELREAIAGDQLEPFFQPQVCARTGRALGFEALVRWRHPERGLLSPFHFLAVAEETGLIEEIGEVVTRRALAALAIWRSMGLPAQRVGLNVSAKELRDAAFVDKLAWDVDAAGLEPRNVAVEILESVLIDHDDDPVIRNVAALSAAGFAVELDDFGTGHASIANLKKFRVNKIKIDRSFITDIDTQPEQQKITRAMINLAHSLEVEALVEGVETEAELQRLRAMGCDAVQGYYVGRPMAEADALKWLQSRAEPSADRWPATTGDQPSLAGGVGV